jgi:hypothetical protein
MTGRRSTGDAKRAQVRQQLNQKLPAYMARVWSEEATTSVITTGTKNVWLEHVVEEEFGDVMATTELPLVIPEDIADGPLPVNGAPDQAKGMIHDIIADMHVLAYLLEIQVEIAMPVFLVPTRMELVSKLVSIISATVHPYVHDRIRHVWAKTKATTIGASNNGMWESLFKSLFMEGRNPFAGKKWTEGEISTIMHSELVAIVGKPGTAVSGVRVVVDVLRGMDSEVNDDPIFMGVIQSSSQGRTLKLVAPGLHQWARAILRADTRTLHGKVDFYAGNELRAGRGSVMNSTPTHVKLALGWELERAMALLEIFKTCENFLALPRLQPAGRSAFHGKQVFSWPNMCAIRKFAELLIEGNNNQLTTSAFYEFIETMMVSPSEMSREAFEILLRVWPRIDQFPALIQVTLATEIQPWSTPNTSSEQDIDKEKPTSSRRSRNISIVDDEDEIQTQSGVRDEPSQRLQGVSIRGRSIPTTLSSPTPEVQGKLVRATDPSPQPHDTRHGTIVGKGTQEQTGSTVVTRKMSHRSHNR